MGQIVVRERLFCIRVHNLVWSFFLLFCTSIPVLYHVYICFLMNTRYGLHVHVHTQTVNTKRGINVFIFA